MNCKLWLGLTLLVFCCGCPALLPVSPPTLDSNISEDWLTFGNLTLWAAGPDATARQILTTGWSVHNGRNGGVGNTLDIVDPTGSMILQWAHNRFQTYQLSNQWVGQTARGAGLGTTKEEFLLLHPEFDVQGDMADYEGSMVYVAVVFREGVVSDFLVYRLYTAF